jgi:hypothetical protein
MSTGKPLHSYEECRYKLGEELAAAWAAKGRWLAIEGHPAT